MTFFGELRRRNVFRVGIAYLVGAWVLLQIIDFVVDMINAPNWIMQVFFLVAAVGLPVVLIFSWVFEMTPEGIKRESDIDRTQSIAPNTGRKLDRVIIAFLVAAVVFLLAGRFLGRSPEAVPAKVVEQSQQASKDPVGGRHAAEVPGSNEESTSTENSIAVLPFVNMSSDPEQEYFSDGITEEILNRLVSIRKLQVVARTSVFPSRVKTRTCVKLLKNWA